MAHIKYKIIPQDVAIYLFLEDFSHKRENEILSDLFENQKEMIAYEYRGDYLWFKQCVMNLINLYELDDKTYNEAELILLEIDASAINEKNDVDCFGGYFKIIKLQLMYSGISYRKLKLRTLLRDFGYKRRTEALISNMCNALRALGMETYLKNHKKCDLNKAKLDDMVIIRMR